MLFHKTPYAANFRYPDRFKDGKIEIGNTTLRAAVQAYEGEIYHIQVVSGEHWNEDRNLVPLLPPAEIEGGGYLSVGGKFELILRDAKGKILLETIEGMGFGVCGKQSIFTFAYDKKMRFYGMGEKTFGRMELSHIRSRFWNVDALGDHPGQVWGEHSADPYYVSVPYLIVRQGKTYLGLLLHNPYETWVDTGTDPSFFGTEDQNRKIVLGAEDGMPSLWIIVGPSLAELTRKLQKLVGVTPRPPLWALGYHQCRWEYKGEQHLLNLDQHMTKHQIPNDGLWLDIDYMEGYRVFTYSKDAFPKGVPGTLKKLQASDRKVVPIIDPGVKLEKGFPMYEEGLKEGHFCLTPEGQPFVGFVWPGETVFPDFSKASVREWWAGYCKKFREEGFAGAWVDMNDPSTGAVDPYAMLFHDGQWSHGAFRNQYALGMQMATRDGFLKARPNERPFVLSRSGYTGTSRFAAIWTGDNVSNRFYLKGSITCSVSLGLSGIPFNGPDVGGFMNDTTEELMVDWVKSGFLFPFFRNHSGGSHRRQEPWTFSKRGLGIITHYTQLRYKLLPYLYQLFVAQERDGDPILRPAQYHFPGGELADDMFMVGPSILQAPCNDGTRKREVKLPGKDWFDARWGKWVNGNLLVECGPIDTPLYFADKSIIPSLPGVRTDNRKDLRDVEFHIFLKEGQAEAHYTFDDGQSFDYQAGKESVLEVRAVLQGGTLKVDTRVLNEGFGNLKSTKFYFYGDAKGIHLNGDVVKPKREKITWTGLPISALTF